MANRFGDGPGARSSDECHRIVGIDPGTVRTGWGVLDVANGSPRHVAHGTIASSGADGQAGRLSCIYRGLMEVLSRYEPEGISLEKVFFARNAQSALKLGQARGIALLAAAENEVAVHEYTSAEIKLAVVGYGQATKSQVQKMVSALLRLSSPMAVDAADALAAALCHLHQQTYHWRMKAALPPGGGEPGR